jgi:dTDP-glucose pyrophosphorylase
MMKYDKMRLLQISRDWSEIFNMFVFPMGGRGKRFVEAGYAVKKHLLEVQGKTVFENAVSSFEKYFNSDKFLFVMREDDNSENQVNDLIVSLGVKEFKIVKIYDSLGQADSVKKGLEALALSTFDNALLDEEIYIFNIDSFLLNFEKFEPSANAIGALDVFRPTGSHFSFIEAHPSLPNTVSKVTEKVKVSDLASTGLYYFKHAKFFLECIEAEADRVLLEYGEVFVAPLFNHFIEKGQIVMYREICNDEIVILGTPVEYETYVR